MQAKNLVDEPKRNTNSNLVKGVTENDSILHQGEYIHNGTILYPKTIHEDFNWLLLSDPEISIVGDEFKKSENLADDVSDYYVEKYSGKITREGIGIVNLSRKSIQASISHGIGKNKRAAFVAVPEVIKYGKVFQIDPNHKDRGYSSTIISAPIKIWNKTFICEVAINKKIGEDESSFYLHNVEIKRKAFEWH